LNVKVDGLKKECMDEIRILKHSVEKIWEENLKVPDLINDDGLCLYKNMAEYCKAQKQELNDHRAKWEKKCLVIVKDQTIPIKNQLTKKI